VPQALLRLFFRREFRKAGIRDGGELMCAFRPGPQGAGDRAAGLLDAERPAYGQGER
jgi:hypothetical protein